MPEAGAISGCDLLVFDLDGTLIDSQQDLADSVNATLEHFDRPPLDMSRVAGFIGDGAALLLSRSLRATGGTDDRLTAAALPYFLAYYRDHMLDTTHAYPGVLEALQSLRQADPALPMAVLTNKPVNPSTAICMSLGLAPFFFQMLGGNSLPTKKPDPQGMFQLMHQASGLRGRQVEPSRTVIVGDSHVDVATARAAGTLSLGCMYGLDPVRLQAAMPDALVDSPAELASALRSLLAEEGPEQQGCLTSPI